MVVCEMQYSQILLECVGGCVSECIAITRVHLPANGSFSQAKLSCIVQLIYAVVVHAKGGYTCIQECMMTSFFIAKGGGRACNFLLWPW